MDKQILRSIMERLSCISSDVGRIWTLMDAPMNKSASEEERVLHSKLVDLIGRISKCEFEAYGECYLVLNKD